MAHEYYLIESCSGMEKMNEIRARHDTGPVGYDADLASGAQAWAEHISTTFSDQYIYDKTLSWWSVNFNDEDEYGEMVYLRPNVLKGNVDIIIKILSAKFITQK